MDYGDVSKVVEKAAKSALGRKNVVRVFTEPSSDAEGRDALRITIVLVPGAVDRAEGDALLNNLLKIHDSLYELGEQRTPIVGYATEEELAEIGNPES